MSNNKKMCTAAALLFLFFLFLCCFITSETNSHITLQSTLTPNTANYAWLSPSLTFAFGFFQHTQQSYAIGIFFATFSYENVVWTANTDNPIVPNNVLLTLTQNGLLLHKTDPNNPPSLLFRIDNSSEPIAEAAMHDNGNFVLYSSVGTVLWQSFDHPTDSLVPGQRLSPGMELVSRPSETDLKAGTFRLKMQTDGNLVLYNVNLDAYYATGTDGRGNNVSLNLDSDGHLYLSDEKYLVMNITKGRYTEDGTVYLMRIDVDGIFRLYNRSLHKKDDDWRLIWSVTDDKCMPKGLCGINSYCTYNELQNAECKCLPGYELITPGWLSGGCTSSFVANCSDEDQNKGFEMRRIQNVSWEDNYYSVLRDYNEELCEEECLNDCSCYVALFRNGECQKQKLPLRYGRWLGSSKDVSFVRAISSSASVSPRPSGHKSRLPYLHKHVTEISMGIFGLPILSIIIYCIRRKCGWCNQGKENKQNIDKFLLKHGSLAPLRYSCKEVKKITKCFTEKLGQGGYGIVYKGKLPDGQLVAVKVLRETHDSAEEFINEVVSISRTSHVNIVNLLGFCYHRNKRALVYEFMPNKSLDKFIYKSRSSTVPDYNLEWKKLYDIAVGVARGLEYLHRGCNTRIVHFDIKPQNILLDQDFCPKISDFGLAKLCMKKQSAISMLGTRGTVGYIAPEVFSRTFGVVSHKADVYSYGSMLLHMVEAKYVEKESFSLSENNFWNKVYEQVIVQNERVDDVMTEEEEESVRKMLMVGFWCIQTSPMERPSMSKVVEMLEGKLQSIQIPPRPFLLSSPQQQYLSFISCNCMSKDKDNGSLDPYHSPCSCLYGVTRHH